jgi:hypothetical protein
MTGEQPHSLETKAIRFPSGNSARLVEVPADVDVRRVIAALELPAPRAVLVLNGGAAGLAGEVESQLGLILAALARVVVEDEITVVSGGTQSGVFALFGEALRQLDGPQAACIGVTVAGRAGLSKLEPHHSHFVLVEGQHWGDETPVMYDLVAALASACPSLALFAGGGQVAFVEMLHNVSQQREMILIAGSKGATDAVVQARSAPSVPDPRIEHILHHGRITLSPIDRATQEIPLLVRNRLVNNGAGT